MTSRLYKWIMIGGGILTFLLWIGAITLLFKTNPLPASPWFSLLITGTIVLPITTTLIASGIKCHEIYPLNVLSPDQISILKNQKELDSVHSENNATINGKKEENGVNNPDKEETTPLLGIENSKLQIENKELQNRIEELNKQILSIQGKNKDLEEQLGQSEKSNELLLNRIEPKWSKAMYELYSKQWNDFFDNIGIEIENTQRTEFLLLLWNIASQTMDFLIVANNDPNTLRINDNITNAIIEGKNVSEVEHKTFYEDPNTTEKKALAVFNFFKSQVTDEQEIQISAFGYDIQIDNNTTKKT